VTATLARGRGTIEVTISDDGVGISPKAARAGIGIRGMRDRVEALGGRLDIFSEPVLGTRVRGAIPDEEVPLAGDRAALSTELAVTLVR
jgi:signal transduction histidine kinase